MSDINWRKEFSFGLTVLALLLPITLAISGLMLGEYAEIHRANSAYQQNAEKNRDATTKEIEDACYGSDRENFSVCLRDKIKTYYKDQATNYDLQAQQDMAYWAKAVFFLGGLQAIMSLAGIVFIWQSLDLTRKTTTAAIEANQVAKESTRAWLDFDGRITKRDGFVVAISNYGQSPAVDCSTACTYFDPSLLTHEEIRIGAVRHTVKDWSNHPKTVVHANRTEKSQPIASIKDIAAEFAKLPNAKGTVFLCICLVYRSAGTTQPRHTFKIFEIVNKGRSSYYAENPTYRHAE